MKKNISVWILALLTVLTLCACEMVQFEIGFVVDGEPYGAVSTRGSELIKMPDNPVKEGYTFEGWYWDDGSFERPFTANSLLNEPLTSDMKVYAKFVEAELEDPEKPENSEGTEHEHSYGQDFVYDDSEHWYTCGCGYKADAAAHDWGKGEVVSYASPSDDGVMKYTCVCGKEKTERLSYAGMDNDAWRSMFAYENVRINCATVILGTETDVVYFVDGEIVLESSDGVETFMGRDVLCEVDFTAFYGDFVFISDTEYFADGVVLEDGTELTDITMKLLDGRPDEISYTMDLLGLALDFVYSFSGWGECVVSIPVLTEDDFASATDRSNYTNFSSFETYVSDTAYSEEILIVGNGEYSLYTYREIGDDEPTEDTVYGVFDGIDSSFSIDEIFELLSCFDSEDFAFDLDECVFFATIPESVSSEYTEIYLEICDGLLSTVCICNDSEERSWSFCDFGISDPSIENTDPPADDNENTDPPADDNENTDPPADDNENTNPPADDNENTDPPAEGGNDGAAETVSITVTVVDQQGNPIEHALIKLRCGTVVTPVYEFTDSDGRITVTDMPAGAYEVQIISAPSQYSYDDTYFPISSDNTVTVTIENMILDVPEDDGNDEPIDEIARPESMSEAEWRKYFKLDGFNLEVWHGTFTSSGYTNEVTRYYDVGTNGIVRDYGENTYSDVDDLFCYESALPLFDFSEYYSSFTYSGHGKYVAKFVDLTDGAGNSVTAFSVVVTFTTSLSGITYQLTEGTLGVDYRLMISSIGGVGEINPTSPDKKAYNNLASNPYDNLTLEYKVGNDTNYTKYTYLFSGANAMILTDYHDGKYYSGSSKLDTWENADMNYGAGFLMGVLDALSQIPYSDYVWSFELGGYTYFDDGSIKFYFINFDTFTFRFDCDGNLAYVATDNGIEYYLYDYGTTVVKGSEPTVAEPVTFDEMPDSMTKNIKNGSVKIDVDPIGNGTEENVLVFSSEAGTSGNSVSFSTVNCDGADTCFVLDMDMCVVSASASNGYLYQITMHDVFMLDIIDVDGAPVLRANASTGNTNRSQTFDTDLEMGEWFNLRIEYYVNAISPTVKVFVNGELVGVTDIFYGSDVTGAVPATDFIGVKIFSMKRTTGTLCIDNAVFAISDAKYTESTSPIFAEK